VFTDLADGYSRIGQTDRARDLLLQALQISPDDVEILYHTGSAYEHSETVIAAVNWISTPSY